MICNICYENTDIIYLDCNHELCRYCLYKWLCKSSFCPYCREKIKIDKYISNYPSVKIISSIIIYIILLTFFLILYTFTFYIFNFI